jgi:ribulose-phosphate 3-epimerase
VVLNPATPVSLLEDVLDLADYVLIMSVNPGFGGQRFIPRALDKIRALERRRRELGLKFSIEIDGGVTKENLAEIVHAGCDWVVSGASIFRSPDPAATVAGMREIAQNATPVRV